MIVTLTAHPSLDRAVDLAAPLRAGDVQAGRSAREDAGGKGVNVARVVDAAGMAARAVLPLAADDPFAAVVHATGLDIVTVPISGRTRTNLTLVDPAGVTTKVNLPGAALSASELDELVGATAAACAGATWLVLAGSLPPGAPDDFYVRVIERVRAVHGAASPRIAVDTSGSALAVTVATGHPDLIKPNDEELAELAGAGLGDRDRAAAAAEIARALVPATVGGALVTLGAAGAVFVGPEGAWSAPAPRITVRSTVGAGDSSLAGYLIAASSGAAPQDRLIGAIRYGAAAAALPGTQPPTPDDLPNDDLAVVRQA